jgi:hypothetical protein
MKCERAVELVTGSADSAVAEERRRATEHAAACAECRDAVAAVHALRMASLESVPAHDPRAVFERALAAATLGSVPKPRPRRAFWSGLGVGAALAASVATAIFVLVPFERPGSHSIAVPALAMTLNELRSVNISLTTQEAFENAEIQVSLSGVVGLDGYGGERRLSWRTDLEPGLNQLTLPLVASAVGDGQVIVEVLHGGKRRTFVVDVRARAQAVGAEA